MCYPKSPWLLKLNLSLGVYYILISRLLKSSSVASSTTSNSISTSSPLSTVTIPISSLGSAGLKLRPVQQIQGKRVIPTTIRVRGPPYSRYSFLKYIHQRIRPQRPPGLLEGKLLLTFLGPIRSFRHTSCYFVYGLSIYPSQFICLC